MPSRTILWVLAPFVLACDTGPIAWGDVREGVSYVSEPSPDGSPPLPASTCPGSAGFAKGHDINPPVAAWWEVRPDSSAVVVASWASDKRQWNRPTVVDSADVSRTGCRRTPPGVFVDSDSNVHVVYPMVAMEGPGIFYAHSMDRAATFHSPVAVVYGERPGPARVTAVGNLVIVAYEDPNTTPTAISIALSTTMAHVFGFRQVISTSGGPFTEPRIATDGVDVLASWVRHTDSGNKGQGRVGTIR